MDEQRNAIRTKFDEIRSKSAELRAELKDSLGDRLDRDVASDTPPVTSTLSGLEEPQMEDVAGGKADIKISSTLTTTVNAYMSSCKEKGLTLDGALAGLSTLGLTTAELAIAQTYVRQAYASFSI